MIETVILCLHTLDSLFLFPHAHGNVVDHLNIVVQSCPIPGTIIVQQVTRVCKGSKILLLVTPSRKPDHEVHPIFIAHQQVPISHCGSDDSAIAGMKSYKNTRQYESSAKSGRRGVLAISAAKGCIKATTCSTELKKQVFSTFWRVRL